MAIKPYIPVYCRPPNKLIRYEMRPFDDGAGHTGMLRVAIFLDKKKHHREMVAQVRWD